MLDTYSIYSGQGREFSDSSWVKDSDQSIERLYQCVVNQLTCPYNYMVNFKVTVF